MYLLRELYRVFLHWAPRPRSASYKWCCRLDPVRPWQGGGRTVKFDPMADSSPAGSPIPELAEEGRIGGGDPSSEAAIAGVGASIAKPEGRPL